MLNTPTRVLLVRDWTIFLETVCIAAGNSCSGERWVGKRIYTKDRQWLNWAQGAQGVFVCVYLDARIYGTDEKDVGKYDEDADVNSQHDRGAVRKTQKQGYSDIFQLVNKTGACFQLAIKCETLLMVGKNLGLHVVLHKHRAKAFEADCIIRGDSYIFKCATMNRENQLNRPPDAELKYWPYLQLQMVKGPTQAVFTTVICVCGLTMY